MKYDTKNRCRYLSIKINLISILTLLTYSVHAQGIIGILNKANITIKLPKKNTQAIENKPKEDNKDNIGPYSGIGIKDNNYQNLPLNAIDTSRLYKIAGDFYFDIGNTKKKYPTGYVPSWKVIGNWAALPFTKVNYLQNKLTNIANHSLAIGEVNGKAYIYLGGFLNCNCAAPLLKGDEHVIINNTLQTFFTGDFMQISNDGKISQLPCKNLTMSFYDTGGWKLKLSMSLDGMQTLLISAVVESLTTQTVYINRNGTDVANMWTATDISLPNLMTVKMPLTSSNKDKET